jgi:hypothetical protein
MIKLRKTGSALMMLIMLVMIVHNTFPHVHHQLESHSHDSYDIDRHSHQSHEHHQENHHSSVPNPLDILSLILGNHSHSQQVVDNTLVLDQNVREKSKKKDAKIYFDKTEVRILSEANIYLKSPTIHFEWRLLNFYTVSSPLRGPPTLG